MNLDFLQGFGPLELIAFAMTLAAGGILLLFVLVAARRARQDMLADERDRRDDQASG